MRSTKLVSVMAGAAVVANLLGVLGAPAFAATQTKTAATIEASLNAANVWLESAASNSITVPMLNSAITALNSAAAYCKAGKLATSASVKFGSSLTNLGQTLLYPYVHQDAALVIAHDNAVKAFDTADYAFNHLPPVPRIKYPVQPTKSITGMPLGYNKGLLPLTVIINGRTTAIKSRAYVQYDSQLNGTNDVYQIYITAPAYIGVVNYMSDMAPREKGYPYRAKWHFNYVDGYKKIHLHAVPMTHPLYKNDYTIIPTSNTMAENGVGTLEKTNWYAGLNMINALVGTPGGIGGVYATVKSGKRVTAVLNLNFPVREYYGFYGQVNA